MWTHPCCTKWSNSETIRFQYIFVFGLYGKSWNTMPVMLKQIPNKYFSIHFPCLFPKCIFPFCAELVLLCSKKGESEKLFYSALRHSHLLSLSSFDCHSLLTVTRTRSINSQRQRKMSQYQFLCKVKWTAGICECSVNSILHLTNTLHLNTCMLQNTAYCFSLY